MNKGFIFAGDSFTWGEGLELLSKLPSTSHYKEQMSFSMEKESNHAWSPEYKNSHRLFQNKHRFARIVADHYESWEDVYDRNGGCPYSVMDELFVQIKRSPLSDISNIIIQITDIWRSVPIITTPENLYFNKISNKSTLSNKSIKWFDSLGNGSGLKYLGITEPITEDNFQKWCDFDFLWEFDTLLENVFHIGLAEEARIKGVSKEVYDEMMAKCPTPYNPIKTIVPPFYIHKFLLEEFSEYGDTIIDIHQNLEIELCRRYLNFIKEYIKPEADKYGVRISIIPPFNDTWRTFLKLEDEFYMNNRIKFYDKGEVYESWEGHLACTYNIESTKGYEWSRNMHPNLEGHKIFANSIIKHLDK